MIRRKNISMTIPHGLYHSLSKYSDSIMEARSRVVEKAIRGFLEKVKKERENE